MTTSFGCRNVIFPEASPFGELSLVLSDCSFYPCESVSLRGCNSELFTGVNNLWINRPDPRKLLPFSIGNNVSVNFLKKTLSTQQVVDNVAELPH